MGPYFFFAYVDKASVYGIIEGVKTMSHYITAKTKLTDEQCPTAALKERFPEATILQKAKVRGYRGQQQREADVVVRFRNPTSESQGEYDLGFRMTANGTYEVVAEMGWRGGNYGVCQYSEVLKGVTGNGLQGVMEGITEPYIKAAVKKQLKQNPNFADFVMSKVKDTEHKMNGTTEKKVKHIRLNASGFKSGKKTSGGWI